MLRWDSSSAGGSSAHCATMLFLTLCFCCFNLFNVHCKCEGLGIEGQYGPLVDMKKVREGRGMREICPWGWGKVGWDWGRDLLSHYIRGGKHR